jgi:putative ABC transport system permease protein
MRILIAKDIFNLTLSDKNYSLLADEIAKNKSVEKIGLASMPFGGLPC